MPRADSKHLGPPFYGSSYTTSQSPYLPDSASSSPQLSPTPAPSQASAPPPKKKHVCSICDRPFSTSGHLARHSRVHTGERNHKCPFPGCETRCSRQDNLQQHYRIHLSPGSRRSSTRSAISRAMNGSSGASKRGSAAAAAAASEPPASPPPLSAPPALEPARVYSHHSTPPDSPPPLTHATLPATAHLPSSSSSRSSSSPEATYPPNSNHHLVTMSSQVSSQNSQPYSYRSGTTTYQEQSQGAGFTYVHTTPVSHPSNTSPNHGSFPPYSSSHNSYSNHSLPHLNTSSSNSQHHHDNPNPPPSSRHSISHISHPHPYPQSNIAEPASPASSQSHTSGPPTPSYVYHEDAHAYHHNGTNMMSEQPGLSNEHMSSHDSLGGQQQQQHHGYSSMGVQQNPGRFDSPPPTLAPIQEHRYLRREDSGRHASQSYLQHTMTTDYQYHHHHQSMALSHGAWKSEGGMRKGVGALVQ
ncbi:hypothetical protein D9615_010171 [Tricholomella constricta]|uniref:C2H2-type domain-containing protein n=1 Tax=Tricholomella constricta TaxID=117010 RepID=A0A8H5GRK2_9AGAR|nr:hypothetical protein D9615_010171 [Tricholomella constricta]